MNTTSYFMRVTAINPISHIGKTASTGAIFNTEKVNGEEIPYITGSSAKGVLRRKGMDVMLSLLGLDPEVMSVNVDDKPDVLQQSRLETLFNGSILRSSGRAIDISFEAKIAELIPWLAVVGGCMGNTMMQGRISVHPMILICEENRQRLEIIEKSVSRLISDEAKFSIFDSQQELKSGRSHLQRQERTHNDDFNRIGSRAAQFLPRPKQLEQISSIAQSFMAKQEHGFQDENAGNHVQMRFSIQTIQAMSQFFWRIDTMDLTPMMEAAFQTTFAYFLADPYIGGMKREGMGLIHVDFIGANRVAPAKAQFTQFVSLSSSEMYANHLNDNKEEIIKLLEAMK